MKMWKEKTWQFESMGTDGNAKLFGVNIFDYEWHDYGRQITVLDPQYKQKHTASVYTVQIGDNRHEFAATEFSNCVYGFYMFKY